MPFSAAPTPSPQSNNDKANLEQLLLAKIPGSNIPKYKVEVRTNYYGINVLDIYEYNGSEYKINHNLSIAANNLLVPPSQSSRQNLSPAATNGSGGAPDGPVEPTQYYSSTNPNSNSPPDFSSSGEGKFVEQTHGPGGGGRRSRKSKKSRKSYNKSRKSKKSRKSRRYRR